MPASANTVWECRATATAGNVNGGGFVTGASGTDFSQQDTAQYALTGVTSSGAGNTFLTASAAANMVGNFARVVSGINFTVGWFEITSVSAGVSVTCATNAAGTSICTGAGASGVINIGGALSLGSTFDDDVFEEFRGGNTCWIRSGNYALGEAINIASVSATSTSPITVSGYFSTRGDNPTTASGNQPIVAMGANSITLAQYWVLKYSSFTTTAAVGITTAIGVILEELKVVNTSTVAARISISVNQRAMAISCEAVSQNGVAIQTSSTSQSMYGCYAHDSDTGISITSNGSFVANCVVNSCRTAGISLGSSTTGNNRVINCTVRGSSGKIGIGINIPGSDVPGCFIVNTTITGCATGINKGTTQQNSIQDFYCNYFDNTADTNNFTKSDTDIAVNPQFVDVTELTGSTATTSGSVLTDSSADFSNVEDNIDFVRIVSGTGVTTGIYLITSHTTTTLTVNNALGTSSAGNVVYVLPIGHNLQPGNNLAATATPRNYGTETTNYQDIGGVQKANPTLAAASSG